jgi:hypothetical protein
MRAATLSCALICIFSDGIFMRQRVLLSDRRREGRTSLQNGSLLRHRREGRRPAGSLAAEEGAAGAKDVVIVLKASLSAACAAAVDGGVTA